MALTNEQDASNGDLPRDGLSPERADRHAPGHSGAGASQQRRTTRIRAARFTTTVFVGLFVGFLLLAVVFVEYRRAADWVDHTHDVITTVERIRSSLTDAETGQRGYLLTRDERYLEPYGEGKAQVHALLDRVERLTVDNDVQQANLRVLRGLAENKLAELALTLRQVEKDGVDRALRTVREGSGERLMAQIRALAAGMKNEEDDRLEERSRRARLLERLMIAYAVAFAATAIWFARSTFRRLEQDFEAERAEGDALSAALRQNTALLDEVNHRVKNSLQVVSSLLRSQALKQRDPAVRDQLLDNSSRVNAIAEVHRRLYGNGVHDTVELADLLTSIAESAMPFSSPAEHAVVLEMKERFPISVREAVPAALIVNELLTNAHKHAFPGGQSGTIRLSLTLAGRELWVEVADDGVGLPDGVETEHENCFGLGMVRILAKQMRATLDFQRTSPGTRFLLRVPYEQSTPVNV